MKLTRKQLRKFILSEITTLTKDIRQGFYNAMMQSKFWTLPHSIEDVDLVTDTQFSTPSAETLMDVLNNAAKQLNPELYFLVNVTDEDIYELGPNDEHGYYPDNWIMRGYYSGPQRSNNKLLHVIVISLRPLARDYNMGDLNPTGLVKKLSRLINHEMIHVDQLKKQAESKGISEEEAWEQLLKDRKQIPQKPGRSEYLSRHNEVDAFAHEAAEELLDIYDVEEALDILRYGKPESTPIIKDYVYWLQKKHRKPALDNFMSKVYSQIKSMADN